MENKASLYARRYQVTDRLHSAAIHLLRRVRQQDGKLGIGPTQLSALSVLVFGGPCSLKQLARAEQVTAPTMSRVVAALERQKLARREVDEADARSIRLSATAKGDRLMQRGRARRIETLAALFAGVSGPDLATVQAATGVLEAVLRR